MANNEFKQAAAIMASDIDTLARMAESPQWTADDLRMLIKRLAGQKDQTINNSEIRVSRYNAMRNIEAAHTIGLDIESSKRKV